jgi:hypothetical protein
MIVLRVAVHMNAYQPQMFSSYARLSSITEMDLVLAQQAQREVGGVGREGGVVEEKLSECVRGKMGRERGWGGGREIECVGENAGM